MVEAFKSQEKALSTSVTSSEGCVGGRYLCKKKLGAGGFGEVWSCIDVTTNEAFAMKIENMLEPSEEE